jgi:serine/threonine-protein kinase
VSRPQTVGRYTILDVLGSGAMGTVYRALDPALERIVAVKVLHQLHGPAPGPEDGWARFRNEARAVARLNHPAIVSVYEYSDAEPAGAFLAMEYVDGHTLDHTMRLAGSMGLAHAFELLEQLLDGLGYAHARSVVHRDIKPSNLLVTREGQLKIADFGIAKIESLKHTQTGMRIGTPQYMAPEQYQGGVIDQRCDLHAAGVLFFQLLAGRLPFDGAPGAVMYQICHVVPPPVSSTGPGIPALLDPLLAKALAKDPDARFQSARDFSAALNAVRMKLGLTAAQMVRRPAATAQLTVRAPPTDAAPELNSNPAPPVSADTGAPTGWTAEQLAEVERELAPILGPMARIVVKRAAARTRDRERLYQELAGQLRSDAERKRFLSAPSIVAHTGSGSRPAPAAVPADTGGPPSGVIADATCRRTTQILARYIGPIAAVLVKKIAPTAGDEADFYARLAERIVDGRERERFIDELTRGS